MKIAFVTSSQGEFHSSIDHSLLCLSVQQLIGKKHEIRLFPLSAEPNPHMMGGLRHNDLILTLAPDIFLTGPGELPLSPELLTSLKKPVIPVGLGGQGCDLHRRQDSEWQSWRDQWIKLWLDSSGALAVEDPNVRNELQAMLGGRSTQLVSGWNLFLQSQKLTPRETHYVFSPDTIRKPPFLTNETFRRFLTSLYDGLAQYTPTLLAAQNENDFRNSPAPLGRTLYCPRFPSIHGTAIASCQGLLTSRTTPLALAASMGVPAVLLAHDEQSILLAKSLNVPVIEWREKTAVAEIIEKFIETTRHFPHQAVQTQVKQQQKQLVKFLETKDLGNLDHGSSGVLRFRRESRSAKPNDEKLNYLCQIDKKSALSFVALHENLLQVCERPVQGHVFLLEEPDDPTLEYLSFHNFKIYRPEETLPLEVRNRLEKATREERFALAKLPFVLKCLETLTGTALFVTTETFFFRDPSPLTESPLIRGLELFPNWNRTLNFNKRYGLYNANFFCFNADAKPVLEWWNRLVQQRCSAELHETYYIDQGYLDLLPLYFPHQVTIYRHLDEGIATWNLESLGIYFRKHAEQPFLTGGKTIGSLQIHGKDPLGAFELKAAFEQLTTFFLTPKARLVSEFVWRFAFQQAAHSKAVARLVATRQRLPSFMKSWLDPFVTNRTDLLSNGIGRTLLLMSEGFNRVRHVISLSKPHYWDESTDFWIPLQRSSLFQKKLLSDKTNRKRKRA